MNLSIHSEMKEIAIATESEKARDRQAIEALYSSVVVRAAQACNQMPRVRIPYRVVTLGEDSSFPLS